MRINRRTTIATAALVLGLVSGGLLNAAPAQAHVSSVEGTATCLADQGRWRVTWVVRNSWSTLASLSALTFRPSAPEGKPPTSVPAERNGKPGKVSMEVLVDVRASQATVALVATWPDRYRQSLSGRIALTGRCAAPTPTPSATPSPRHPPTPTPTAAVPQLPVTGGRSGLVMAGGIVMVSLGAVILILVPRRRRIRPPAID